MALWTWYMNAAETTLHYWIAQGAPIPLQALILMVAVVWPGLLFLLAVVLFTRIADRRERTTLHQVTQQGLAKLHGTHFNPEADA